MKTRTQVLSSTIVLVLLIPLAALALLSCKDSSVKDLRGWGKTRWGMSPEKVAKLYGVKIGKLDFKSGYESFNLIPYEEDKFPSHSIKVFFGKDRGLNRVYEMVSFDEFDLKSSKFAATANKKAEFLLQCNDIHQYFNSLQEHMLIKYGPPIMDRKEEGGVRVLIWALPSTVVRLTDFQGYPVTCATIAEYVPNKRD